MILALVDRLRALPPPLAALALSRLDADLGGPEATASLETAREFHRRPAQRFPRHDERQGIVVYTGDFGAGKTWTALQLLQHLTLTGRARAPRLVAATGADARSLVAHPRTGLLQWREPGVSYLWEPSKGWEGELTIGKTLLTLCSVEAPRSVLGVGSDVQLLDDPPKWGPAGKGLLVNALRSAREKGTLTIIPTTGDGLALIAEVNGVHVDNLAEAGVLVIDLGRTEDNAGNLDPAYLERKRHMQRAGTWDPIASTSPWASVLAALGDRLHLAKCPPLEELAVSIDPNKEGSSKPCEVGILGGGRAGGTLHIRYDRSGVLAGAAADGWPKVAWDLAEQLHREHPRAKFPVFIFESNVGKHRSDLLYAEERNRRGFNARCEVVYVKAMQDKCERAAAPARVAGQGQVRFASDLHELEGQLRGLTPKGLNSDRADAANHLLSHLGKLGDGAEQVEQAQAHAAAVNAWQGMREVNRGMPAPAFPGGRV